MSAIDSKIITCIRTGQNNEALAYLYKRPLSKIRKYILSNSGSTDDANDIFQDTVIVLFQHVRQGKYKEGRDLEGFLFTVAKNLWIDKVRRSKKIVNRDIGMDYPISDFNDQLKDLLSKEKTAAFRKVFEKLGENCQKILQYAIFEKLSMREISLRLGFSNENVAKSNHYRCKKQLGKIIQEDRELVNLFRN